MMTTVALVKLYFFSAVVFFALDMIWLGAVAKHFYRQHIGGLLRPEVNWPGAIIFYLIFIAGIEYFAIVPSATKGSAPQALLAGALFGFVTYATYDLTNYATMKDFPLIVVIVDMAWGTVLSCAVTAAGYFFATRVL
jgi:uncharacterized membrane protein